MAGPLSGYRIIEIAGIGPGPFAAMLLADMGAEVIRVDRAQAVRGPAPDTPHFDVMQRGRRNIALDLKHPDGVATLLDLVEQADALIEGFRPGVMERLGVGPDACLARNPKLVFGRMTGWGQEGPYSQAAGHDINYISLAGALAHIGRAGEAPVPPLNLVGDFGGGGMFLAYGVVCALLEAQRSGQGQVVDTAMVDGAAVLMSMFWAFKAIGMHDENKPGTNLLDTGAHFYDVFECSDGKYVSLGSIEPQFYAELLQRTGLSDDPEFTQQMNRELWPHLKDRLREVFRTRTRDEWCAEMEMTDVCFAPVLTMSEAAAHPHNVARGTFVEIAGTPQPAPAPRFSRTVAEVASPPAHPGQHSREVLADWGFAADRIEALVASGAVKDAQATPNLRRKATMGTLVCFHAHPDDESISTGGTMARAVAEGHRVVLVVATNGDHGEVPEDLAPGETLVDRRRLETEASCAILGVHRLEWLGYADSGMTGWEQNDHEMSFHQAPVEEAAERLATILRDEAADVLTTYDWHGNYGHPDHIKVHTVGHRAAVLAGTPRVFETTMNRDEMKRFFEMARQQGESPGPGEEDWNPDDPADDGNPFGTPEAELTHKVDVGPYVAVKRASIRCHASQITDAGFFSTMPDDAFAMAFGTEWYIERDGSPPVRDGWLFE